MQHNFFYVVDWSEADGQDEIHDRHFGKDRQKAVDFARRKSLRTEMAFVVTNHECAGQITPVGHIAYVNGFRDHTEGLTG